MLTNYYDIIRDSGFRSFVENRLAQSSGNIDYTFATEFPTLYRYRSISSYAVDDIVNEKITMTAIGEFNDIYDGVIHYIYEPSAIERKMAEIDDSYKLRLAKRSKRETKQKAELTDYLGTYVCCFSLDADSELMWSHYANSNQGMCIEYDFNLWPEDCLLRSFLFPIAYMDNPMDLSDLLNDKDRKIHTYPLDAAVLCASIAKGKKWSYENEWRLLFKLPKDSKEQCRITINAMVKPKRVILGNHFLRPLFYTSKEDAEKCERNKEQLLRLLQHMKLKNTSVSFMIPEIGRYHQTAFETKPEQIISFLDEIKSPLNIRYFSSRNAAFTEMINSHDIINTENNNA